MRTSLPDSDRMPRKICLFRSILQAMPMFRQNTAALQNPIVDRFVYTHLGSQEAALTY